MTNRITLQPGDYIATKDLSEDDYHAVARAFMAAGCPEYEVADYAYARHSSMGWARQGDKIMGLYHGGDMFFTRQLTLTQILNATNAGGQVEKEMTSEQWVPEVGATASVANEQCYAISYGEDVIGKDVEVKALFDCEGIPMAAVEHDGVCYCFRVDMLSESTTEEDRAIIDMADCIDGFEGISMKQSTAQALAAYLISNGYRKQPQPADDMNDPANWKVGDLLECLEQDAGCYSQFSPGDICKIESSFDRKGFAISNSKISALIFLESELRCFRFVRRP